MSPMRTTALPAQKHSRSSRSGEKGLIAKEKTKKQSAKRRTALDNRFHRTDLTLNCGAASRAGGPSGTSLAAFDFDASASAVTPCFWEERGLQPRERRTARRQLHVKFAGPRTSLHDTVSRDHPSESPT